MSEDNQQLTWFKNKHAKDQRHNKALEESLNIVTAKLRKTMEENRIVRQRTKMKHEENKEEVYYLIFVAYAVSWNKFAFVIWY